MEGEEGERDGQRRENGDEGRERSVGSGDQAAAPEVVRSSSSAGQASLRSPTSPNPSFSSLQARPTPPATSGRSSPSPSVLSNIQQERFSGLGGPTSRAESLRETGDRADDTQRTTNRGKAASSGEGGTGQQVDPLAATDRQRGDTQAYDGGETQRSLSGTSHQDGKGVSPLRIDVQSSNQQASQRHVMALSESDADSDRYGIPSPRDEGRPGGARTTDVKTPFAAGYGEVPYGLSDSHTEADEGRIAAVDDEQTKSTSKAKSPKVTFDIRVGDPQKVGDPVTAHIVYTVRIRTNSPLFHSPQFSVLRRYSDFRWLHAALVHNNPGIFIPPVPEKVRSGRFAPDLVEARRHGLESCVNKVANNPVLQLDEDLRLFLESQNFHADVKTRDQVKGPVPTPEQKSYFGWSTSLTGTTYRYREQDEWFEEQKVYLDHLEMHLKSLVRIVSALAQQRKDVAMATSETSHALLMLSGSSLSRSLSTCFAGLGEVQRRTFELADLQADADIRDFGSVLYEFERMVGSARKAFATRLDAWQTWQRLEDETKKVRVKHEKVKKDMQPGSHRAHDGGRLHAVLDELAKAETKCLNAKREFDIIGWRCKEQMDLFEADRIDSFHQACEVWLQGMIERNHEIMAEWEQYAALLERQTGQKIE